MAIWQYTFLILPNKAYTDLSVEGDLGTPKDFDAKTLWMYDRFSPNQFNFLSQLLPINKSWSKSIILFGKEDTNCVEISVEDSFVIDVSLRIDFTTDYTHLLTDIVEFCIIKGFIMVDEQLNVVPLQVLEIVTLIEHSPQRKKFNILTKSS